MRVVPTPLLLLGAMLLPLPLPFTTQAVAAEAVTPPVAESHPVVASMFGDRREDDYAWLREKSNPEVIAYLDAENRYTQAVMQPLEGLVQSLYTEMLARVKETDESVPYRRHGYWYYQREVQGLQYPIYCRRKGGMEAPEEVMLDVNELAKGHGFTSVGLLDVSPDGKRLAYTVDFTGYRQYTLHVKDLASGELARETAARVTSLAWAADSATVFYVEEDEVTKRSYRMHRMTVGEAGDAMLYEERDDQYDITVADTRSEGLIVLTATSKDTSEARILDAREARGEFRLVEPRHPGREYYVDHHGDELLIRTNDRGPNFRLVRAPLADPSRRNWKQVVAHRPLVMLEEVCVFKDFWCLVERDKGLIRLRFTDFATGREHYMQFDEAVYSAQLGANYEFETPTIRVVYESLVTPRSWYEYNVADRTRKLLKRQPVLGHFDPADYQSEALTALARDGTRVPVSIVYRKSMRKAHQPQPMLLYGYGSYGIPMDPWFSSARISLLDRGMIFAIAHVRGGGDRGRTWYDDGKLLRKKNTFTDFIACADSLVRRRYTTADKLVIQGGSAGGLLVGAVANMRPDLFKAVVAQVPFVDVMNTMLDPTLPLTTGEYLEWGNPNEERFYSYMRSYSPYDNVAARAYPAMLVETSLNDSQVGYWEAAKYVAKLRSLKTDRNPLLLKTIMEAGHGGASGRYDALKEVAFTFAFVLDQAGLAK
ncbi:MAG TPA: S9 family peptidase [Usitatibacter sp.]|nr:S9 family peptidase [Usitatibacter sp.]